MTQDITEYDYELPPELVAHTPPEHRTQSRLMVCQGDTRQQMHFADILEQFQAGDLVVFNDTRVVPCRLHGRKSTGGLVEIFVLYPQDNDWNATLEGEGTQITALVRSNKPAKPGLHLTMEGHDDLRATLIQRNEESHWTVRLQGTGTLMQALENAGKVPLPPYITSRRRTLGQDEVQDNDQQRYQTVYAQHPGAVAAPTAGLHFSQELLQAMRDKGVQLGFLTLHVGIGTFKPLSEGPLDTQELHEERYIITDTLAQQVAQTRQRGGRIIAVGTTSTRALEDQASRWNAPTLVPGAWRTRLFLRPGSTWHLVQGLVTNFHLPKSSLLVLVASLMGFEAMRAAYIEAVQSQMRFYSYGDAMLIWRQEEVHAGPL